LPPITLPVAATIRDLKLNLQSLFAEFAFNRQKLLFSDPHNDSGQGIELKNSQKLQSYQISNSSNVVLIMLPKLASHVETNIDDAFDCPYRLSELISNCDLRVACMLVNSIGFHHGLLLKLFEANRSIHVVKIRGSWTEEHFRFCVTLLNVRPDIEIRCAVYTYDSVFLVVEFCKLHRLSSFGISDGFIAHDRCRELAPALQSMSSWLKILELSRNFINDDACDLLKIALQSMISLETLDLHDNCIGCEGCHALAPALKSMTSLQSLFISENKIRDMGCAALASALLLMPALQNFDLHLNRIGDTGCAYLLPALQSMMSLKSLYLSDNLIGNPGCRALASVFQTTTSLQIFKLYWNPIDVAVFNEMKASLELLSVSVT
jgi:hypothetical protein